MSEQVIGFWPIVLGWQPMHSAPKNKPILMVVDGTVGIGDYFSGEYWTFYDVGYGKDDFTHPSHWMPLPEPPL